MNGQSRSTDAEARLDWPRIASAFHVLSGRELLASDRMERHQDVKHKVRWLAPGQAPLVVLFISHRWETLAHPDPSGAQHKAIQNLLRAVCVCAEAVLVRREERLQLVPSADQEGFLQATEIVRRMLGFGPFGDHRAGVSGTEARKLLEDAWVLRRGNRDLFRDWLAGMIGVWVDYTCMPQQPLAAHEEAEFRQTLRELDKLAQALTVIALRHGGDDYTVRGWCASEFFLGSGRSFSRSLSVDMGRLANREPAAIIPPPPQASEGAAATEVMRASHDNDLAAWQEALKQWALPEGPLATQHIPDLWSPYRDLQGSTFAGPATDPNPFRRVLDAISDLETSLVEGWLMTDQARTLDLAATVHHSMQQQGLRCAKKSDLVYLAFLVACEGWIDAFRPLFRECLRRYVEAISVSGNPAIDLPQLIVTLAPLDETTRNVFFSVRPCSAATWYSRLRSPGPSDAHERAALSQVRKRLEREPLCFAFSAM